MTLVDLEGELTLLLESLDFETLETSESKLSEYPTDFEGLLLVK